jgi:hypothetical protein
MASGSTDKGLYLAEKLRLEVCEVRSALHRLGMSHEPFGELIEGGMTGWTDGRFRIRISRRPLHWRPLKIANDGSQQPNFFCQRLGHDRIVVSLRPI